MRCGKLIPRDSAFCGECGYRSPFGFHCPACLKPIEKSGVACPSCGKPLYSPCPECKNPTFIGEEVCEHCNTPLLVKCTNPRCGQMQFFENERCTACGKKIKIKKIRR
jgi:hypothetical protein